jgi:hypothetical protein
MSISIRSQVQYGASPLMQVLSIDDNIARCIWWNAKTGKNETGYFPISDLDEVIPFQFISV